MTWIPVTDSERAEMLGTIGVNSVEDLFAAVPEALRMRGWDMPPGLSEMALRTHMDGLAVRNKVNLTCFLGGGYYDHFIPAAVDAVAARSEFYTAYTPYQPEASQGSLQAFFEYQTLVAQLTGMDVSNASLYDGGSAAADGVRTSPRHETGKDALSASDAAPASKAQEAATRPSGVATPPEAPGRRESVTISGATTARAKPYPSCGARACGAPGGRPGALKPDVASSPSRTPSSAA